MAKIYINVCKHCGRKFATIYLEQKYCTKKCRIEARKKKIEEKGQKCWSCGNACGGCSWSKEFKPVKGWIAEPCYIKEDNQYSYDIKYCPEYIYG